jgi:hypothetical protein
MDSLTNDDEERSDKEDNDEERGDEEDDNEEEDDNYEGGDNNHVDRIEGRDNDHDDEHYDNGGALWDLEHQSLDLNEDDSIELDIAQSELDQLAQWDGLAVR